MKIMNVLFIRKRTLPTPKTSTQFIKYQYLHVVMYLVVCSKQIFYDQKPQLIKMLLILTAGTQHANYNYV